MSTSPENQLVNVLSHWLARHVDNAELLRELEAVDSLDERPRRPRDGRPRDVGSSGAGLETDDPRGVAFEFIEACSLRTPECHDEGGHLGQCRCDELE